MTFVFIGHLLGLAVSLGGRSTLGQNPVLSIVIVTLDAGDASVKAQINKKYLGTAPLSNSWILFIILESLI